MSMIDVFREMGRANALKLREEAAALNGTQIIAREHDAPMWDEKKDYSAWPAGSPVTDEGQVWLLLQPHNAAHYPGSTPENTAALWSIRHTKDPARAKPWAAPAGTSGLYMADECCLWDGAVYRCVRDDNPYSPGDMLEWWELVM